MSKRGDFSLRVNMLDNLATHKTPRVRNWFARRPRYVLHFTPTGSSWINQVERWFAKITTQAIRRGNFRSVKHGERQKVGGQAALRSGSCVCGCDLNFAYQQRNRSSRSSLRTLVLVWVLVQISKKGRRADPGALGERESLACKSDLNLNFAPDPDLTAFAVEDEGVGPVPSLDDVEAFLDFAPERFRV